MALARQFFASFLGLLLDRPLGHQPAHTTMDEHCPGGLGAHGRLYNICASQPANHIERRAHTHNLCLQFAFSSAQPVSVLLHRFALDPGKSIFVRFPSARPSRRRFTIAQSLQNVQQSIPCHKIKKKDMKPRGVKSTLTP